jgi:hypothetical protein
MLRLKLKPAGRIIVFFTAVIMLAVMLPSLDKADMTVNAVSLKHIEEIVAASGEFKILEIVPDVKAASIGYYIDGAEPVSDWKTVLAGTATPEARTLYANKLFGELAAGGILSEGTATPLRSIKAGMDYTEAYLPPDLDNWQILSLNEPEHYPLTGTMTPQEGGPFQASYDYSPEPRGGYVQSILYFTWSDTPDYTGGEYYYDPLFLPITPATDISSMLDDTVYELDAGGHHYTRTYTDADGKEQPFTVRKYMENGGFDMGDFKFDDPGTYKYFYVDSALIGGPGEYHYKAKPVTDADGAPVYTAVSDDMPSFFTRTVSSFTYVISGGNYAYSAAGTETYDVRFKSVYYQGGFINNNLFKQQVFGLGISDLNVLDVTATTREAAAVTESEIAGADLIYISSGASILDNGAATEYGTDIPEAQAYQIHNKAAEGKPVIVDYRIVDGITQATPSAEISNIEKIALLCLQSEMATGAGSSFAELTVSWPLLAYITNDTDKTFVKNNIYCFDPFNTDTLNGASSVAALASASFGQPFSAPVYTEGFSAVLEEIKNENFLHQIAGGTVFIPETVTVSSAVRHIINFQGQRQLNAKTTITVLDLEPAKVTSNTWLTNSKVLSWLPPLQEGEVYPDISIVHMTTGEFIGKIEDMVETYDMIYIGMSVESFNKDGSNNTRYNDSNMNGLVYSNIGDTYNASLELAGIRDQDYLLFDGVKAVDGSADTLANKFRFSGNDITASKIIEFEKFARAGYPIILGSGFTLNGTINNAKIDCRSYMYQAIQPIYNQQYPNVMSEGDAAVNKELVKKHLNVSKPSLNVTSQPCVYVDIGSEPLTGRNDGYYDEASGNDFDKSRYLTYKFSVSNVTDPTPISTTYDCRLYIDLNADGRFNDNEELGDIEIRRGDENGELVLPQDQGKNEYYALSAGTDYMVIRQMPNEYVGIIPWKLEVLKNGALQIHASAQGFTRIAATSSSVKTIKVLQIMDDGTSGTELNLKTQQVTTATGTQQLYSYKTQKYYTGIYGKLLADLDDFNVQIDVIETDDLEALKGSPALMDPILERLNEYAMLIIGFNDCYDGIGPFSADAIVEYINSGKSVLFTHDTTSLTQTEPNPAYPGAYPLAEMTMDPDPASVYWNGITKEYKSFDGNIGWQGDYNTVTPPYLKQTSPTFVVYLKSDTEYADENGYFGNKAGSSGNYRIYRINNISSYSDVAGAQVKSSVTSSTTLQSFRTANPNATIVYVYVNSQSGWYGSSDASKYSVTMTAEFIKFVSGKKYVCSGLTFSDSNGSASSKTNLSATSYTHFTACLARDNTPESYKVIGKLWKAGSITDWGYYFNTIIRDWVGLDRYGVTSKRLGDLVDTSASMNAEDIQFVLNNSRSVAFLPKSETVATVPEYQGYTNYALIRFAGSNTYRYTNNTYSNRETENISQVNKGQITTYPYNVNTASFGGTDNKIIDYGGSYMMIGKSHEQYFQINMNTDDIVVWYCLSNYNGATKSIDPNSYYDDVPNDCVNAYYIYNKGNVTYSGVGHTSDKGFYTGSDIGEQYINEAKLFVNTMIAAYQSGPQEPKLDIKQDARGVIDLSQKYVLVNPGIDSDRAFVMASELGATNESRAVYFRITDPNVGDNKEIKVTYYVADPAGAYDTDLTANVISLGDTGALQTYNVDGSPADILKGGYVYKLYLPDEGCLERLAESDTPVVTVYIKMTTTFGGTTKTAYDSIVIKKQQLFSLS